MNLSTDEKYENICVCIWQVRDQIKIGAHRGYFIWIVALLNNVQVLGLTSLTSIVDWWTKNDKLH